MRYLGGKYRLKKEIGDFLNDIRLEDQPYWEPFVGGAWVTTQITEGNIFCSDINTYLIKMWSALLGGWMPPDSVSEDEYKYTRKHKDENPALTSFVGFGCSWGGKWFGGYARGEGRNWAREARDSLLRKAEKFVLPIKFFPFDFLLGIPPDNQYLIYCDPPYKGTTGYDAVKNWSSALFWEKARELDSKGHTLVISEYKAPEDFRCVKSFETKTDLNTKNGKDIRIERLFMRK